LYHVIIDVFEHILDVWQVAFKSHTIIFPWFLCVICVCRKEDGYLRKMDTDKVIFMFFFVILIIYYLAMCDELCTYTVFGEKHPIHYRLSLEEGISIFNNFWYKYCWHNWLLNNHSIFHLT